MIILFVIGLIFVVVFEYKDDMVMKYDSFKENKIIKQDLKDQEKQTTSQVTNMTTESLLVEKFQDILVPMVIIAVIFSVIGMAFNSFRRYGML